MALCHGVLFLATLGTMENLQHNAHDEALIEVIVALHRHAVEPYAARFDAGHQIFVVQTADGPEHGSQYGEQYPPIVAEVDALALTRAAEHIETEYGQHDTHPLVEVEPFAEDE